MLVAHARTPLLHRGPPPVDGFATVPAAESAFPSVRRAGAAFVRGTTLGWSRRDLANWLVCQYAPCTTPPVGDNLSTRAPAAERTLDDGMFERVIVDAHAHVVRLLRDLGDPALASPIARLAIASGSVVGRADSRGRVYAPVARIGLCIHERAESLFIADYLNNPHEYCLLRVCSRCGELSFEGPLIHAEWCEPPSAE